MCEFVSWIKHKGIILFLEDKDLQGRAGKELKDFCGHRGDWAGHGAIRHVYGLASGDGENCECTDFSSPDNFPSEIVAAIKNGRMTRFGTAEGILSATAWAQYDAVEKTAMAQYNAVENTAWTQYKAVKKPAWDQYDAVKKPAWDQYDAVKKPAWEEYETVKNKEFWRLFAVEENRASAWKKGCD